MPYEPGHDGSSSEKKSGLKNGIKILRDGIDKQLEFITWLKTKGLYNLMESSDVMQKMYDVWREMKKDR